MAPNQVIMNNLKVILGNDVEPNIVDYICSMKHEEDYEEFMENILEKNKVSHINAYTAIKDFLFGKKTSGKAAGNPKMQQQPQQHSSGSQQNSFQGKKDKKKFKDINAFQEKVKKKEGRHPCDCLGQEHEFMNNCLECGRIHCIEEGPGPCLFCGTPISVRGEENALDSNSKKSIMKHKLNKVFDDDNDYFKANAKKAADSGKQKMVIALDFASRKVIESTAEDVKIRKMLLQDSVEHLKKVEKIYKSIQNKSQNQGAAVSGSKNNQVNDDLVDLLIQMRHKKPHEPEDLGPEDGAMPIINYKTRVFDEDLIAKIDQGLCMSLHQPYASLLVAGVKRHEGRVWSTTHRGRLWIAAAAKEPDEESVEALEIFYRQFYNDPTIKFPKEYPTSCLLGSVYVEDCLDQETYKKRYANCEESGSPYVLICSNPIILPIFFPISGKHKIYPLDKELHNCAKMALQHAKYV